MDTVKHRHLKISVREFVMLEERSGHLDLSRNFSSAGSLKGAGQQIHSDIQSGLMQAHAHYKREVVVSHTFQLPGLTLELSGRIDSFYEESPPLIEEIKSTANLWALRERLASELQHPYILQLKMYAFLHYLTHGTVPRCRLLLVSIHDPENRVTMDVPFYPDEFAEWVEGRMTSLMAFEEAQKDRRAARANLATTIAFPFEHPRVGQLDLIGRVGLAVAKGARLLLQAPTGLGKTAGVLYPTLRDALSKGLQVFYITPKNSQHQIALDTIRRMRQSGSDVRASVITAKEKMCFKEERICHPESCEYARNYYDKLKDHDVLEKIAAEGAIDRQVLEAYGRKFEVCPFELSLDVTAKMDVVICDYNYVFSPNAALQRYFGDDAEDCRINLIIDEAHNLYARAMEYFSPSLAVARLQALRLAVETAWGQQDQIKEQVKEKKRLQKLVDRTIAQVLAHAPLKSGGFNAPSVRCEINREAFFKIEESLGRFLTTFAEQQPLLSPSHPALEFHRVIADFCDGLRLTGEKYVHTFQRSPLGDALQVTCCDASEHLAQRMRQFAAVVAFSATVKPFDFYATLSGLGLHHLGSGDKEAVRQPELSEARVFETAEFHSNFPRENRKILVIPQVSTSYKDRDRFVDKIAEVISRLVPLRKGNYFVFFPSFAFLESVATKVTLPGFRIFTQTRGMSHASAQELLKKLEQKTKNVVIFAVQGGSFAEGIDCPGDTLVGAFIVGPALPTYNLERECIRQYYDTRYGAGFDFAYTYPAMSRVVQAAGRVIRTENDKGLIVLLDKRFTLQAYASSMPGGWFETNVQELVSHSILDDVSAFWRSAHESGREPS